MRRRKTAQHEQRMQMRILHIYTIASIIIIIITALFGIPQNYKGKFEARTKWLEQQQKFIKKQISIYFWSKY